jgi:GTPase SAR1 family protein
MGCTASHDASTSPESIQSKNVENYLYESKIESLLDFKILLLGAGESGKSTVVKQLKVLHKVQMDDVELQSYAINIHKNTLQCMQVLLDAQNNLSISLDDPEAQRRAEIVKSFVFGADHKRVPVDIAEHIDFLWKDPSIQKVWGRRSEYWFLDATPYYIDNLHRFMEEGYSPSEEDIIMTRVRTTGIAQTDLDEGNVHFRVVDVGGQRNERKKWIHCFDDVKALLFVVNLAGYDQVMFEDPTMNRMKESLNLFSQICNNPVFANTPIFLCLNKKDIFEQMIQTGAGLEKCFEDYKGGADVNVALAYIQEQFQSKVKQQEGTSKERIILTYFIAARFKKDVKYTWDEVKKILLEENKKQVQHATKYQQKKVNGATKV